eukprot:3608872-Pleurochrysis_carterae.AAC.3
MSCSRGQGKHPFHHVQWCHAALSPYRFSHLFSARYLPSRDIVARLPFQRQLYTGVAWHASLCLMAVV